MRLIRLLAFFAKEKRDIAFYRQYLYYHTIYHIIITMSSLIIIAHPNKQSFSHAMANAYASSHPDHTILDLYDNPTGFLRFDSMETLKKGDTSLSATQKLIQTHDELVFFFPVWRGSCPAILKNFFDVELASGFAFQYVKGKALPNKLLTGKTAKIFCTCDGPSIIYRLPIIGISIGNYLRHAILGFCGIKTTRYKLFGSLRKQSDTQREKILATIAQS